LSREDSVLALSAKLALVMVVVALPSHKVRGQLFDLFERTKDGIDGGHDEVIEWVTRGSRANMQLTKCRDRELHFAAVEKAQRWSEIVLIPLVSQHENLGALRGWKSTAPQRVND